MIFAKLLICLLPCVTASRAIPSTASGNFCGHWTAEVVFVQDISDSYRDDIITFRALATELFTGIDDVFPNSKFALAGFADKPHYPVGYSSDVCYKVYQKLTSDIPKITRALNSVKIGSGLDYPESQFDAIYRVLESDDIGWSTGTVDADGNPILRVLILATDDVWHLPGDLRKARPFNGNPYLPCAHFDYPSLQQVKEAFHRRGVTPLFLISHKEKQYASLLKDIDHGGSVETLSSDSSNIIEAIQRGLEEISCQSTTSTLYPPVMNTRPTLTVPSTTIMATSTTTATT
eukprot:Lankesteria_metandrocarpae@DN5161_c0_g1_i1.p2